MKLIILIPFLNEEKYIGRLMDSFAAQTRRPDCLVLADDGSTDQSAKMADDFAVQHPFVKVVHLPRRPAEADRLAKAAELNAFHRALEACNHGRDFDVIAKMDGDLDLPPDALATLMQQFEADPKLGIAGTYLSLIGPDGKPQRERSNPLHVRGATKFYRRQCYEQIAPLPQILGWDTIDEMRAAMHGWQVKNFELSSRDIIHLRPTGSYNGALRGYRRRGLAAYAYGAHPLFVLLGGLSRMREKPRIMAGLYYLIGFVSAALKHVPRAEPELRAAVRRDHLARLRRLGTRTNAE